MSAQHSVIQHIAQPYASALYDLASEAKSVPAIEKDLDALLKLIEENDDFSRFLSSPVIAADAKAEAMNAILAKASLNGTTANFLKLVARNGRLFAVPAMIAGFKQLSAKARGEVSAEVTSAAPLTKEQMKSLADTLKKKIGKTVTLQTHVDPSLIGGLQVKVGSQMIDTSLKTKLAAMKIAMKEVG